ncbi:MAG: ComEC/Rec2 family competence protein [Pirellulaceae bacterium]
MSAGALDSQTASRRPPRVRPLVLLLAAYCAGVVLARYCPQHFVWWWTLSATASVLWLAAWLLRRDGLAVVFLLLAVLAGGAAWLRVTWNHFDRDELALWAGEALRPTVVEGVVVAGPRRLPAPPPNPMRTIPEGEKTAFELQVGRVRDGERWRRAAGCAVLLVDGEAPAPKIGDRLRVFANLSAPSRVENPGQFDYAAHERASRRTSLLRAADPDSIVILERGSWWRPAWWLEVVRDRGKQLLRRYVGPRQSGLAIALLLGAREDLDREQTEDFFAAGAIHLLAISGLHVGILALGVWGLGRIGLLSRRRTLVCVILLVAAYAVLTGARPPVVRAAVLIGVFCGARLLGRPASSFNVLALAGFVVLALSPAQLFHAGTQLSFLAVATLLVVGRWFAPRPPSDPLDQLVARTRPWPVRAARSLAIGALKLWLVSMLVWLVAAPLVMHQFHLLAFSALALNPLLWLPIAAALFSGFGVMVFGAIFPPLGQACGAVCAASLDLVCWMLREANVVPAGHMWVAGPNQFWMFGTYALLAACVLLPLPRARRHWYAAIGCVWLAVGLFSAGPSRWPLPGERALHCTFVSVGHGTSVLVELPDGRTLLYDAGTLSSPHSAAQAISGVLWSRGLEHLDAVVISHADADHYNALPELLERFSIGAVYVSPVMFRDDSPALDALRRKIDEAGVPLREVSSLDRFATPPEYHLEVLHPLPQGVAGSDNANSIVLLVEYDGRRILLPGDLETPGLEDVLAEQPLDTNVAMAPHHGSGRSNPSGFAAWSTPEFVVISGGHSSMSAEVRQAYEQSGAEVLHTAEVGAVRIRIAPGEEIEVRSWREGPW